MKTHNNIVIISKLITWMTLAMFATASFSQTPNHGIKNYPYYEGFEKVSNIIFQFNKNTFSYVYLDSKAAYTKENGLLFHGSDETSSWVDPAVETPSNIWEANFSNKASASVNVDATKMSRLILKFNLKQIYRDNPEHSLFKLFVNGEEVSDIYGKTYFTSSALQDAFSAKSFDLSKYTGKEFTLSFESCCKTMNDCVLIDNISLSDPDSFSMNEEDEVE